MRSLYAFSCDAVVQKKKTTLSKGNPVEIELLDSIISFWKKNLLQQEFIWLSGNNGIVQLLKADTGDLFLGKKKKLQVHYCSTLRSTLASTRSPMCFH